MSSGQAPGTRHSVQLVLLLVVGITTALGGCDRRYDRRDEAWVVGGNSARGEVAIRRYGCGACHVIPGIRSAKGSVGPALGDFRTRTYIAGVTPNSPESLVRWIRDPPGIDPLTAMPNLNVSERDARDIANYLYALD
jgi:cytochrome c